jgi:hypothetical protein
LIVDRSDKVPERYWVLRAFSHHSFCFPDLPDPTVIRCALCDRVLLTAGETDQDDTPLLMFDDKPICPDDALGKISGHPITPTYLKWLEEGDPRWWSPWFCDCDGCEPLARTDSA